MTLADVETLDVPGSVGCTVWGQCVSKVRINRYIFSMFRNHMVLYAQSRRNSISYCDFRKLPLSKPSMSDTLG
jgi:hypothetical protein